MRINGILSGDAIGVIAPSRPISNIKKEIEDGIVALSQLGFVVKTGKNIDKKFYYSAGSPEERVSDLHEMFSDSEVKAIICATGGSSANQLLELIDYEIIRNNPKIFVGYSDISILLLSLYKKAGLVTYYGPTVYEIPMLTENARNFFLSMLEGKEKIFKYPDYEKSIKSGNAEGELVGGLLSRITSLLDTDNAPDFDGKILFWEEVNTCPAMIDFHLQTLRLAGVFGKIKGMVIGHLHDCVDKKYPQDNRAIEDIVLDRTKGFNLPIIKVDYFGHKINNFYTIPIGAKASLDTEQNNFSVSLE